MSTEDHRSYAPSPQNSFIFRSNGEIHGELGSAHAMDFGRNPVILKWGVLRARSGTVHKLLLLTNSPDSGPKSLVKGEPE
jgi:hypothetical protein